ncbi:MAG: FAD-dependent oxidoreductase [Cyanobium sp.]
MRSGDPPPLIAIVGAGYSGTMVACHLLRRATRPLSVVLIDRSGRFGQGLAYGTADPGHLLNVSVGAMSAWDEDPSHLLRWLDLNRESLAAHCSASIDAGFFLPRTIYGLYLRSILDDAESLASGQASLQRLKAELVDLEPLQPSHPDVLSMGGGYRLLFQGREPLLAHRVVLAWGNSPSPPLGALCGLERHGWAPDATSDLEPDASVVLLGTGLTMVDMVVSLMRQGHRGSVVALSRRGLQPLPHRIAPPIGPWLDTDTAPSTVLGLWRLIRQRIRQADGSSVDWRPVIDGLRPITQRLWGKLNDKERRRFLRHAAVFWDVHRHRIAPQLHEQLQRLLRSGQLQVLAGRLKDVRPEGGRLAIAFRRRGDHATETLVVDRLIHCTGLPSHGRDSLPPLQSRLQSRGLLQPDPLGLGLQASEGGALLNSSGEVVPWLYTLGTPLRGQLWESIAVPELRKQAEMLARSLLQSLPPHLQGLPPLSQRLGAPVGPSSSMEAQPLLFRQLFDPQTSTFTYLLADPRSGDAALVDPVLGYEDRDLQLLQELRLSLRFCLETHLHADHITAAGQLRRRTGCRLIVPAAPGISNADQLPGHDSKGRCQSTIREERECNPRLAGRSRAEFIQIVKNLRLAPPKQIASALPANRYLGDLLPADEYQSDCGQLHDEQHQAEKMEAANKDALNDFIGMFI